MGDERHEEPVKLSLMVIRVADLASSRRFYEQLGLAFHEEQHGSGPEHLSTVIGGTVVELYPVGSGPSTQGLRLGLVVANLTEIAANSRESVIEDSDRDGHRFVVLRDPDGHKVELTEPVA
jgi:catechol 2,3-dioxygenase-like lactoylglutathione lyase family enzyme